MRNRAITFIAPNRLGSSVLNSDKCLTSGPVAIAVKIRTMIEIFLTLSPQIYQTYGNPYDLQLVNGMRLAKHCP